MPELDGAGVLTDTSLVSKQSEVPRFISSYILYASLSFLFYVSLLVVCDLCDRGWDERGRRGALWVSSAWWASSGSCGGPNRFLHPVDRIKSGWDQGGKA